MSALLVVARRLRRPWPRFVAGGDARPPRDEDSAANCDPGVLSDIIAAVGPGLILLDADGVLWRGSAGIPQAPGFIRRAHRAGVRCVLISNNAGPSRAQYATKCQGLGLELGEADIFSVNYLAGPYLGQRHPGAEVLVVGSDELAASVRGHVSATGAEEWLSAHGGPSFAVGQCRPVEADDLAKLREVSCDIVLVGIDHNVNYLKLALACVAVQRGALLIGANQDLTFPVEDGLELPGTGSTVRLIAGVTGAEPTYLGKPEPHLLELIARETGVAYSEMLMLGDRVETDIVMAQRAGIPAFLVLTGVTSPQEAPQGMDGVTVAATLDDVARQLGF